MARFYRLLMGGMAFLVGLAASGCAPKEATQGAAYPLPRLPSYIKAPTTVEDVMAHARAAVRQTGGRTPLGLVEPGKRVALFAGPRALVHPNPLVLKAIVQAYEERGIKARVILPPVENQQVRLGRGRSSKDGFMEAEFWLNRWSKSEEPKAWLREKSPDVYEKMFPSQPLQGRAISLDAARLADLKQDPNMVFWQGTPKEYMDRYGAEIDAVFAGYGGRPGITRRLERHGPKFYGNFIFDHYLEVMSEVSTFPGDLWRLVEERVIEPLRWVDRAVVTDPEGTDFSFDLSAEHARMWAEGTYQQGHLFMFPHQATGRQPYSIQDFPRLRDLWQPPVVPEVNGILAGTKNHTGFYPRMEVVVEGGRVKEVREGGEYGEFLRAFVDHPKLREVRYPYYDLEGYWFLYEAGLGTNPKFFQRPDELMDGFNSSERNVAGVIHWGFGAEVEGEPQGKEGTWARFTAEKNVPNGHWMHIHNVLPTYRVRIRGTETWVTLIEKGRLAALDHPEVRALASRYGNPDRILRQEWVPDIPGITSPGNYQDFARDPWSHVKKILEQIGKGTYPYLARD